MKTVLLALIASVVPCLAASPHAWDCFTVDSIAMVDATHYEVKAHNRCDQDLPTVVVLVKYIDKKGTRIGAGVAFRANYVAAHERVRRICEVGGGFLDRSDPAIQAQTRSVMVRAIREDALEELK